MDPASDAPHIPAIPDIPNLNEAPGRAALASLASSQYRPLPMPGPPSEQELEDAYKHIPLSSRVGSIENPLGQFDPIIPDILPHEQVFSIQVGEHLFKLSGASLSSDAPSYFTTFFLKHKDLPASEWPILYIDRSPKIFSMIVSHLQGYYVKPDNDVDFVYLLLDANYYHLPRLVRQLTNSEFHVHIGGESFRIARNVFNGPGDTPNFFTLGFSTFFGSEISPPRKSFKRPPPLAPPSVPQRSGELFKDLIRGLQGSSLDIKDEKHRSLLLAECRYYRFLGLEQKLMAHSIRKNRARNVDEIVIELRHIRPKQLKVRDISEVLVPKSAAKHIQPSENHEGFQLTPLSAFYKRPFVDTTDRELIIQLTSSEFTYFEPVGLCFTLPAGLPPTSENGYWEAVFYDEAAVKIKTILTTLANGISRKFQKAHVSQFLPEEPRIKSEEDVSPFEEFGLSTTDFVTSNGNENGGDDISLSKRSTSPTSSSESNIKISIAHSARGGYLVCADDAFIVVNGKPFDPATCPDFKRHKELAAQSDRDDSPSRKRQRIDPAVESGQAKATRVQMILTKSQWRIVHTKGSLILEILKGEGHCGQKYINAARSFV